MRESKSYWEENQLARFATLKRTASKAHKEYTQEYPGEDSVSREATHRKTAASR
jgi:hypothetical protein